MQSDFLQRIESVVEVGLQFSYCILSCNLKYALNNLLLKFQIVRMQSICSSNSALFLSFCHLEFATITETQCKHSNKTFCRGLGLSYNQMFAFLILFFLEILSTLYYNLLLKFQNVRVQSIFSSNSARFLSFCHLEFATITEIQQKHSNQTFCRGLGLSYKQVFASLILFFLKILGTLFIIYL